MLRVCWVALATVVLVEHTVSAAQPTARIGVEGGSGASTIMAAPGQYAALPSSSTGSLSLLLQESSTSFEERCVSNPSNGTGRALLGYRGGCAFGQQVLVAQAAGFEAVIIRNTLDGMYVHHQAWRGSGHRCYHYPTSAR